MMIAVVFVVACFRLYKEETMFSIHLVSPPPVRQILNYRRNGVVVLC